MGKANEKALEFIKILVNNEMVGELENHDDQGVKVSAHTYDVLKVSIDEIKRDYKDFDEAKRFIDFFAIIVGVVIHDLSKGSIRKTSETMSHSQMMLKKPDYIIKEADSLLEEIETKAGVKIKENVRKNITHIVVSHHGRWGKIVPNTREAHIVHRADMYSAKYHRINPIGANEILESLCNGENIIEVSKKFMCTTGVIKDRLKRAKQELRLKTTKHLVNYYKKTRKVPIGDNFFTKRVRETAKLISAVEKRGFRHLIMTNQLMDYLVDDEIFQIGEENERENRCPAGKQRIL